MNSTQKRETYEIVYVEKRFLLCSLTVKYRFQGNTDPLREKTYKAEDRRKFVGLGSYHTRTAQVLRCVTFNSQCTIVELNIGFNFII